MTSAEKIRENRRARVLREIGGLGPQVEELLNVIEAADIAAGAVTVPREATSEMVRAAISRKDDSPMYVTIYRAMITAAAKGSE